MNWTQFLEAKGIKYFPFSSKIQVLSAESKKWPKQRLRLKFNFSEENVSSYVKLATTITAISAERWK